MEFEWDQAKSDRNLRGRGFDFDQAIQAWENGQTLPDAPARTPLRLIDADPERAFAVLAA